MKTKILIFALLAVMVAVQTGCKSYEIQYNEDFCSTQLDAGIYVSEMPSPFVNYNGGELIKVPLHSKDIKDTYESANLREMFYEELLKNKDQIGRPRIAISMNRPQDKNIQVTEISGISENDPDTTEFDLEGIPEKFGKDYLLIIKITNYGFREGKYSVSSRIEYIASIVDLNNNKKIWQTKSYKNNSFSLMSGINTAKNLDEVRSNLRDCVIGVLVDISDSINN